MWASHSSMWRDCVCTLLVLSFYQAVALSHLSLAPLGSTSHLACQHSLLIQMPCSRSCPLTLSLSSGDSDCISRWLATFVWSGTYKFPRESNLFVVIGPLHLFPSSFVGSLVFLIPELLALVCIHVREQKPLNIFKQIRIQYQN